MARSVKKMVLAFQELLYLIHNRVQAYPGQERYPIYPWDPIIGGIVRGNVNQEIALAGDALQAPEIYYFNISI